MDANLPPDQTVIATTAGEAEAYIDAGESLVVVTEPSREPGAVATFVRSTAGGERLYRVDAQTFWASVDAL